MNDTISANRLLTIVRLRAENIYSDESARQTYIDAVMNALTDSYDYKKYPYKGFAVAHVITRAINLL